MYDNEISKGYNLIKWGILLSALHINLNLKWFGMQIIPAFIGFILIAVAINKMYKAGGERYFSKLKGETVLLVVLSVIQFIVGLLFGYADVVGIETIMSPAFLLLVYMYELVVYSDLLNMTVRLYKDNNEIRSADKLRKDRRLFVKLGMVLAIVYGLAMIPHISQFVNYSCVTLTLVMKIWLSLILQNVPKKYMEFKKDEPVYNEENNDN